MKIFRLLVAAAAVFSTVSAFAQAKIVLGRLGQTTASTRIYASPTSRSRIYYRAKPYEYLVLKPYNGEGWYKVMLQNGADGYVSAQKVTELPYQVTEKAPTTRNGRTTLGSRSGADVARYSMQFQGTPYKWGGNDVYNGIDCSGFVKKMFGTIGISLPRTAAEQGKVGLPIKRLEDLQAGDRLYFWSSKRNMIGHTGIYLGNGWFINASSGHGQVTTDYLGKPYWLHTLVAARR